LKLWIALWHHRFGVDVRPYYCEDEPAEDRIIRDIGDEFEGDAADEWIEVRGPFAPPDADQDGPAKDLSS